MTDKRIFTRQNIHDSKMNMIIIRLDFSGVSDSNELVKKFDKQFPGAFKRRYVVENREINLSFREHDFESISESLSMPIEAIKKERFTRYEGINGCIGDVWMDVSQFYLCMTIRCKGNYDGITNYVAPFKGAIKIFKDKLPYFDPKRLGIRKVRIDEKTSIQNLVSDYESFVYPCITFPLHSPRFIKKEYFDVMEEDDTKLRTNIRRILGVFSNKQGETVYKASLDIDAYYHEDALEKGKINDMLTYANEKEFELYKCCMTFDYLNSICW